MDTLVYIAGAITVIGGALAAIVHWAVRPMIRTRKRLRNFLDDWDGEPPRPGVPERLGVMARLARIEHQVHPNSGGSLRDVVDRIEQQLGEHLADESAHGPRQE